MQTIILLVFSMLIGALGLVTGYFLYPWLKDKRQGYPNEAEIEAALLPWLYEAICSAFETSELAVDELGKRMHDLDKKAVADIVYDLLPDRIGGLSTTVIKTIIPRERFRVLVQDAYDHFSAFYNAHERRFEEAFEEWKRANTLGAIRV